MKHFLVTDDQGNPVFVDSRFDADQARMLCLPFAITQDLVMTSCHEKFTAMRCGDKQFVFTQYDSLLYMVVSDEGESVPFLRRQLQLIYELLQFKFGPRPEAKMSQHQSSIKFANVLRPLIYTMINLGSSQQSYLVQSIERLEVNDDLRARCMRSLEDACLSNRGHGAAHVLLFVGTKLLVHYSRADNLKLSPSDIFLISLYIKSLQEPPKAEQQPSQQAPTMTESFVSPISDNIKVSPSDEEFVLAREEAEDGEEAVSSKEGSARDAIDHDESRGGAEVEDLMRDMEVDDHHTMDRPSIDSDNVSTMSPAEEAQPELCVFEKLFLRTPNYMPYFVYMGQVAQMTTMVVISDSMKGSDHERAVMALMQQSIKRSLSNFIDFLIIKEQTHLTVIAPVIIPLDNEANPRTESGQMLSWKINISFPEKGLNRRTDAAESTRVDDPGNSDSSDVLHMTIQEDGGRNVTHGGEDDGMATPLVAQTAKSSPEPGRSSAASESSSHAPQSSMTPPVRKSPQPQHELENLPGSTSSWATLKQRVWEMVFSAQDRLSQGYTSMVMQSGGFQYSYHLWFEDDSGNVLTVDQPIPSPELSFDGRFYRDMARKFFPTMYHRVNCYELYTLHLAVVPSRMLVAHNRRLIRKLREGRVARRIVG